GLPGAQPWVPMVFAATPAQAAFFAAAGCSNCHDTTCEPLPSPFMVTAPSPLALGPSQSWLEKVASDANVVPSPNGSAATCTASAIVDGFEDAVTVLGVPSLASVPTICASSCSDPSADAV